MSETSGPHKIPKRDLWGYRYRGYRHKYGRVKAFWRAVVLTELYMLSKGIVQDDMELMEHLVQVTGVSVEWHRGDGPPPEQENGRSG